MLLPTLSEGRPFAGDKMILHFGHLIVTIEIYFRGRNKKATF